jgi:hypothetical protein
VAKPRDENVTISNNSVTSTFLTLRMVGAHLAAPTPRCPSLFPVSDSTHLPFPLAAGDPEPGAAHMAGRDERWGARGGPGDTHASTSRAPAGTAGESEGASPDSLRNTPSNIARLEDAIGHCAARRKYLAHTKSPSDGKDVRWYFCNLPLADKGAPPPVYPLLLPPVACAARV